MANLAEIRDALVLTLDSLSDLNVYGNHPDLPAVPAVAILPPRMRPHETMGPSGIWMYEFILRFYAAKSDSRTAQDLIDSFLARSGAHSLPALFEADPTLGGTAHTVAVTVIDPVGVFELGDLQLLGCEIHLEVLA